MVRAYSRRRVTWDTRPDWVKRELDASLDILRVSGAKVAILDDGHITIRMPTKTAHEAIFREEDRLREQGISFDTGTGFYPSPYRDWEFDDFEIHPTEEEREEHVEIGEEERKLIRGVLKLRKPSKRQRVMYR